MDLLPEFDSPLPLITRIPVVKEPYLEARIALPSRTII